MRMIVTTPFARAGATDLNLGQAYNEAMRSIDADWVCLMDYDAMWLTPQFYEICCDLIEREGERYGLITVKASRTGSKVQHYNVLARDKHNILWWRQEQREILSKSLPKLKEVYPRQQISGHVMIIRREAWEAIKPAPDGLLGVDWVIAQRIREAGYKIGIIPQLVVYHYYRGDGNLDHLRRANRKFENPYP